MPLGPAELSNLLSMAEAYPTLKELRGATQPEAVELLTIYPSKSDNWPTRWLVEEFLGSQKVG